MVQQAWRLAMGQALPGLRTREGGDVEADGGGKREGGEVSHTYSVRTWDTDLQAYTPQAGLSLPWKGLTRWQLKSALRELRRMGYGAYRKRALLGVQDGKRFWTHDCNDFYVLVERDDKETNGRR